MHCLQSPSQTKPAAQLKIQMSFWNEQNPGETAGTQALQSVLQVSPNGQLSWQVPS